MPPECIFDRSASFWNDYNKGRPVVPSSFFEHIFAFHSEHGGAFGTLHEPGAGNAVHTARLAQRFHRVVVSDPSAQNIELAKDRLSNLHNCEFWVARLEDTENIRKVDMVISLNMLHLTDIQKAMEAVAYQLKPGGTFATATFALAILDDQRAQDVWLKMWRRGSEWTVTERDRALQRVDYKRGRALCASANDGIPFSETHFKPGVVRRKIHCSPLWSWSAHFIPPGFEEDFPPLPSGVGLNDKVEDVEDNDWKFSTDLKGLGYMMAATPWHQNQEILEDLWDEMKTVVGDSVVHARWAVTLAMATRK